jgi:putative ABC transport system substrate-binding protein
MRRRDFIKVVVGSATAWPLAARAQQSGQMKHLAALMNETADNPEGQSRFAAFLQGLQEAGWAVGRNLRIDIRWGAGDIDRLRRYAAELVSLAPDVILSQGSSTLKPLLQATRTVPICSRLPAILSAPVSSTVSPGPAATRPALCRLNTV